MEDLMTVYHVFSCVPWQAQWREQHGSEKVFLCAAWEFGSGFNDAINPVFAETWTNIAHVFFNKERSLPNYLLINNQKLLWGMKW